MPFAKRAEDRALLLEAAIIAVLLLIVAPGCVRHPAAQSSNDCRTAFVELFQVAAAALPTDVSSSGCTFPGDRGRG